ncbi:MAG TPA: hypothetical protein VKY19_12800 [Ktedonosporobacter sp.]|jgi:uncharacterized membrane protein YgcG|nr:hypothetical protein [Ktedonosporobacter sp.]
MRPLPDRLNDRLEQQITFWRNTEQQGQLLDALGDDPEVDELIKLADRIQSAPFLEASPVFARHLEQRLLQRNAQLQQKRAAVSWWSGLPLLVWRPRRALLIASIMLLCLLLGTGVLAVAQASSPTSPLYVVKNWEQNVQISLAHSPLDRAEVCRQIVLDRLKSLTSLTTPSDTAAYYQDLADIDQQIDMIAQIINTLPAGADRNRLTDELAQTRSEMRTTLRGLLPLLTIDERLQTTDRLAQLGDTVPHLQSVFMVLSFHPQKQATISLIGSNLANGAQLLVDNRIVTNAGSLQNGVYVFVISWQNTQSPHTIGILNPDGTAAQTNAITLVVPKDDQGNNSDNGHRHNDGGGSGGGGKNGSGGDNGKKPGNLLNRKGG